MSLTKTTQNKRAAFVMQPHYLPWIGIFKAIDLCDDFVFYTDAQFEKQSWQQRNRILNTQERGSEFVYLRVPLERQPLGTKISEIRIREPRFWEQHVEQIGQMYKKAPYTQEVLALLEPVYRKDFQLLADLNIALTKTLAEALGLAASFLRTEDIHLPDSQLEKTERLVVVCQALAANEYLAAAGARSYLETKKFEEKGIAARFLEFEHPVYPQLKEPFVSHLSIVDALCHLGPQQTGELIRSIKLL